MRRLKPDPVPDELLERLVQAAIWAPNGANRQAMEFVVVTDRALMARLAQLWGRSVDAYLNSLGRVTPATQDERVVRAAQYQREHFHETPALIVACYRKLRMDARTAYRMHSASRRRRRCASSRADRGSTSSPRRRRSIRECRTCSSRHERSDSAR
jgi:nitroreductase